MNLQLLLATTLSAIASIQALTPSAYGPVPEGDGPGFTPGPVTTGTPTPAIAPAPLMTPAPANGPVPATTPPPAPIVDHVTNVPSTTAPSKGPAGPVGTCLLTTNNNNVVALTMDDKSNMLQDGTISTLTLTLQEPFQETTPTTVDFNAPGITCGRQQFTFDPNDRSTYKQSVTCRTDGGGTTNDNSLLEVPMTFKYTSHQGARLCRKLMIKRKVRSNGRAGGQGDPHLTTLDKVNYDFQVAGVFRFLESNNLLVQVFQEKCGPTFSRGDASPSCYQGVAISFGGSIVKLFIENGKIALGKGTSSLQWLSVERLQGSVDGYRIFTKVDQATYIDVTRGNWINNYPYLNVAAQISPYFKNPTVNGLMGNWNGNPTDDLTDNTKLASLHGVALTNNLFTCTGFDCASFSKAATLSDEMAIALPSNMPLVHKGYTPVDPATIVLKKFTPVVNVYKKSRRMEAEPSNTNNREFEVQARRLCTKVINSVPVCEKYVANRTFVIESVCVSDAVEVADLSVVDLTKLAYLRDCRRELDSRIVANASTVFEMHTLLQDRASLHFGDLSTCAKDCSGRGTCLTAGCQCNRGFSGFGCDTPW